MLQLWYQKPATYWEEALPLGNGRLGAMVWSGVDHETLSLNEDSLWSGYPKCADIPGAVEYYKQAQQLAREKKYSEAQELLEDMFLSDYTQSYLPLADLKLELEHPQGDVENYRRSLSLEDAISRLTYTIGGTTYTREAFVSAPDQAIVLRIQADKPGSITLKARFDCRLRSSCTIEDGRLVLDGVAPSQVDPSYLGETPNPIVYEEDPQKKGMRFCAILEAQAQGGTIHPWEDALEITGADSVTLLVAAQTSFNGPFRQPYLDGKPYKELCLKDLNAAAAQSFEALRQRHVEDYKSYFDRVSMNLGPDEDEVPTVERLARWNEDVDPQRYALLYQYGRYLIISGSPARHPAHQPPGHLEQAPARRVELQLHHQHQHGDELLACGDRQPFRAPPAAAPVPPRHPARHRRPHCLDPLRRPGLCGPPQHGHLGPFQPRGQPRPGHGQLRLLAPVRRVAVLPRL